MRTGGENNNKNQMGLFSATQQGSPKSTMVRCVTAAALGFTALVILGVANHSGLTQPHQPRASSTNGLDPTQMNLGEGVGTTPSHHRHEERRMNQQQKPQLEVARPAAATAAAAAAAAAAADADAADVAADVAPVVNAPRLGHTTPFPSFDGNPAVYKIEVVNKFPHDPAAFTQGFLFQSPDTLFESTGSVGGPSTVGRAGCTG
jgi:hypothetical protein